MLRPIASPLFTPLAALLVCALVACGGSGPRPTPVTPPSMSDLLPADAPLTAVVRPAALRTALTALGIDGATAGPADGMDPIEVLRGLGIDPEQPVWLSLRAGPVLGVLRAAEDAARVLADGESSADPRVPPGEPLPPGPFGQWLRAHPLPPAWVHLRLAGRQAPRSDGQRFVPPEAWLAAHAGALAVARTSDPAETLAATLDTETGPAGAILAALDTPGILVYRLLDRPLPTAVVVNMRGGAEDAVVVDVLWDRDLGAGGLAAAMAALPEVSHVWGEPRTPDFDWPADDELLRVGVHHGGWFAADRMLREVAALQAVLGQGPLMPGSGRTLARSREQALLPERLMAPVARALVDTTASVVRAPDGLRVRLEASSASAALAPLRDGTAPIDHGALARALPADGFGLALTLAQPPAELERVLGPHLGAPDRPLAALWRDLDRCGVGCLPAAWSGLAYGRALPATVAHYSGHAPLEAALAEATGLAGLWIDETFAVAVGHRAPATVERATWGPIVERAGLESRWVLGERAVLLTGRAEPLEAMNRAARAPAVTDAAVLRFTAVGVTRLRFDGALSFDGQGVAVDLVIDRPAAP